jgi:hypothetical protein
MSGHQNQVVSQSATNLIADMRILIQYVQGIANMPAGPAKQTAINNANRLIDRCDQVVNVLSTLNHARSKQLLVQWTLFYQTFGNASSPVPGSVGQIRGCEGILTLCIRYLEEMIQGH